MTKDEALEWIVVFMCEHPEWTSRFFTEGRESSPEACWLREAKKLVYGDGP